MSKKNPNKKKSTFWADFKKFITRGNVVDMAVGVIIGSAFSSIVSGLVNYIINPFIGIFLKTGSLDSLKTVITEAEYAADGVTVLTKEVAILWGTWLQTIINFLITAFCLFLILRIVMRGKSLLEAKKIEEEKAAAELKRKEDEEKAAAAKAEQDAKEAALAEREATFYANIQKQTELLEKIAQASNK